MSKKRVVATTSVLLLFLLVVGWQFLATDDSLDKQSDPVTNQQTVISDFKDLVMGFFDSEEISGLKELDEPPVITGNEEADERIRELAERRGQTLQLVADDELEEFAGVELQSEAGKAWEALRAVAEEDGIDLELLEGHRSIEEQREVFLEQLSDQAEAEIGQEYTEEQIAGGTADVVINTILRDYEIPGYTRLHTGYVVTLSQTGVEVGEFEDTPAYEWLSDDSFARLRELGLFPNYVGWRDQRPGEYVWIGAEYSSSQ